MGQSRGSAFGAAVMAALLLFLVFHMIETAHAATYTVGDAEGWDFDAVNWPKGKTFKAGDQLIFKYPARAHNVVVVDAASYKKCTVPPGAKVYSSGNDVITLQKGDNYFICGIPTHCNFDMKIAVNAA